MNVQTIFLEGKETPQALTVDITIEEAVLIARYVGNLMPSTEASTEIWDALSGVFNRYWDDGLRDAERMIA